MTFRGIPLIALLSLPILLFGQNPLGSADTPFNWFYRYRDSDLEISVSIPAGHYLYEEQLSIEIHNQQNNQIPVTQKPESVEQESFGYVDMVFPAGRHSWLFPDAGSPVTGKIKFQGCRKEPFECLLPEEINFTTDQADSVEQATDAGTGVETSFPWQGYQVAARQVGYVGEKDFLAFIDQAELGDDSRGALFDSLENRSLPLALVLILLGGLALNLTPCVLPMIPINLAIIGAGAQAGSQRKGFLLGGLYGLGITLIYGVLGLAVVLTGTKFGSLNSSPWFNLTIGIIFILLALAMFDVFTIDFSRYQKGGKSDETKRGSYLVALIMGGVSALLAGACVAPVVIAVLLYSLSLYSAGNPFGLTLPFILGLGMALPWPFAGAGLSFLPKPGKWMLWTKKGFGILILLFAVYYGYQAWKLSPLGTRTPTPVAEGTRKNHWINDMGSGFAEARRQNKDVIIDFWATWCKNCTAMEKTTLRSNAVQQRLENYVKIKFQAENPRDPAIKAVMDELNVLGLPTFIILQPETSP